MKYTLLTLLLIPMLIGSLITHAFVGVVHLENRRIIDAIKVSTAGILPTGIGIVVAMVIAEPTAVFSPLDFSKYFTYNTLAIVTAILVSLALR